MEYTAQAMMARNKEKRSRQEMIDRTMCKPGYTWNETLGKCLAMGGGRDIDAPEPPSDPPADSPDDAIAKEVSARAMQG